AIILRCTPIGAVSYGVRSNMLSRERTGRPGSGLLSAAGGCTGSELPLPPGGIGSARKGELSETVGAAVVSLRAMGGAVGVVLLAVDLIDRRVSSLSSPLICSPLRIW